MAFDEVADDGRCFAHPPARMFERYADNQPQAISVALMEVSAENKCQTVLPDANTVLDSLYEGLMVVSTEGFIVRVNPAFERITGYSAMEVVGQSPKLLSSGHHGPTFYEEMWEAILQNGQWRGELWNRRKNGELFLELLSISAVRDRLEQVQHYVGVFADAYSTRWRTRFHGDGGQCSSVIADSIPR